MEIVDLGEVHQAMAILAAVLEGPLSDLPIRLDSVNQAAWRARALEFSTLKAGGHEGCGRLTAGLGLSIGGLTINPC